MDDIFTLMPVEMKGGIIKSGIAAGDKIILEGGRQVHDGDVIEDFEFRTPEEALAHQKNHAE